MNKRNSLVLSFMCVITLVVATYTFKRNSTLEKKLFANMQQCDASVVRLSEKLELEIEAILQEIDRQDSIQASAEVVTVSDYSMDQYEQVEDIVGPTPESIYESIEQIVARKYRFLFSNISLNQEELKELRLLLIEREGIALKISDANEYEEESGISKSEIGDLEYALEDIDTRIAQILNDEDSYRYTMLKNSDEEQKQFNQYALGINGLFPLSNEQQEAVLFTRLKHKQAFDEMLTMSGIDEDYPLTLEQSETLLNDLKMAAMRYKDGYLMDMHSELDHDNYPMDQYSLLENSVNTEFKKLINSLHEKIKQRGIVN